MPYSFVLFVSFVVTIFANLCHRPQVTLWRSVNTFARER